MIAPTINNCLTDREGSCGSPLPRRKSFGRLLAAVSSLLIVFLLASALTFGQSRSPESKQSYIAKIGNSFISESEFLERFELTPGFGKRTQSQLEVEKLEFLYSIVAEKLLAQEAVERGIDKDTLVQAAISNVRKLLARDELFRREVSQKVRVSPKEIEIGMRRARGELFLKYLFFEKEEEARFVRSLLKTTRDFDHLTIDTTMTALRDTVTLTWGDADPAIESAAYGLNKNETSQVIIAGDGFYILTLASERSSQYYSSMQPTVFRERVEAKLRARKEKARMEEFVHQFMSGKNAYGRPVPLKALSEAIATLALKSASDSTFGITPEVATEVRTLCQALPMDSVVVIGNEVWSLDIILDKLVATGFSVKKRNPEQIFGQLNYELKIWAQQELLAQEALARGLDQTPSVSEKLEMWRQHYLAEFLKSRVQRDVKIKAAEIWSYLADQDKTLKVPEVQIRELRTGSLAEMNIALNALASGKSFESVVLQSSTDSTTRQRGGLTEYFPITTNPFGPLAWEMNVGERQGPLKLGSDVYVFELVHKRIPSSASDTSFAAKFNKAANDYGKLKQKGITDVYLAHLGNKFGFTAFEDRLKQIQVSAVPMVTFRVLGFGGRMFEVPFVDKQIDWLGIDASQSQTIQ